MKVTRFKRHINAFVTELKLRWILSQYKVMTIDETIVDIIDNKKSISRFGDGEFMLMLNNGEVNFQRSNVNLAVKLGEVINNRNPNILIAVPDSLVTTKTHNTFAKKYWKNFITNFGYALSKKLDKNYHYGNANMTRFYAGMQDKSKAKSYFEKIKKIWHDKELLIVEGELSRLGVGNDLFDNAKNSLRIICPKQNAFDSYAQIKEAVLKNGRDKLILVALGPTATVLCSELSNNGYWAIDIGHIDVEYMWMLMGSNGRTAIKGKLVNESDNSEGYELDPALVGPYKQSIILDLSN